ncbi:hypothetical protein [Pelomonas sp. Root1444]|uniref:hypothetical protein n=1 Tax=Pelomonas sp. Root1444 TaxID=1736464 RepID=UPI000702A92D|nr:hypothetical protein [Pelomonas sp. Root1444]KQY81344.1 hypothetical protein ASD35_05830 [Pelomonas sp. Root1444]
MSALLRSFAVVSLIAIGSAAQAASYQIPENIGYKDVTIIPSNIVEECKELGRQLSGSLAAELTKSGAEVQRVATLDAAAGPVIDIKISNMVSAGNAFIGHRKSASVWVELRQGSEVLGAKGFTRDTMGGAFAGFKGSCTVLERAVLVLGKDVAQWTQSIPLRTGATAPAPAASAP